MKEIKILFLLSLCISLFVFIAPVPVSAQLQPASVLEMTDQTEISILKNGDAEIKETLSMSPSAFINFKQRFPVFSTFTRLFKPANTPLQIENLEINVDEAKNQINAEYIMKGVSINNGDYWATQALSPDPKQKPNLVSQNGNILVFSSVTETALGIKLTSTTTIKLPEGAKNINFDAETNAIGYALAGQGTGGNSVFLTLALIFMALAVFSYFFLKEKKEEKSIPETQIKPQNLPIEEEKNISDSSESKWS